MTIGGATQISVQINTSRAEIDPDFVLPTRHGEIKKPATAGEEERSTQQREIMQ